jgi:hypothetical protein
MIKRRFVFRLFACTFLSLAAWVAIIHGHKRTHPRRIAETAIVTSDGIRLSSVFDGMNPDPRNQIKGMSSHTPTIIRCSALAKTTLFDKVTGFLEPSVLAQGGCSNTPCGGQNYIHGSYSCVATGCQGSFASAYVDYQNGSISNGAHEDGSSGCTSAPGYSCTQNICNFDICDNGIPPPPLCDTCSGLQFCSPGYDCVSGCCQPHPCAGGAQNCGANPSGCGSGSFCDSEFCCEECSGYPSQCEFGATSTCTSGGWQCVGGTPIVIDVMGDGFDLTDIAHGVSFDISGKGTK